MKVAIIGLGFVGKAVQANISESAEIFIVDPFQKGTLGSVSELPDDIDISFICVPTPMDEDGSVNGSILRNVIEDAYLFEKGGLLVVKSTIVPSFWEELDLSRVIYNPEFLREATAAWDFMNPDFHVIGTEDPALGDKLMNFYYRYTGVDTSVQIFHTSHKNASFVKYGLNVFFMSKAVWMNQFEEIVTSGGGIYDDIIEIMKADSRMGSSHMKVPGPDGRRGSAGPCFSKDVPAFIQYAETLDKPFTILERIASVNQDYRNSYGKPLPREVEQHIRFDLDFKNK